MPKRSAGLLVYRCLGDTIEVLLAHPGGPFWARRDAGNWSIPKGEFGPHEDAQAAAFREFGEETGLAPPQGLLIDLGDAQQPSRKIVTAFAVEGTVDATAIQSNLVEIEWPPRSGRRIAVPEIDRAAWFTLDEARIKILPGQAVFLDRLLEATATRKGIATAMCANTPD